MRCPKLSSSGALVVVYGGREGHACHLGFSVVALILEIISGETLQDLAASSPPLFKAADIVKEVGQRVVVAREMFRCEDDLDTIISTCIQGAGRCTRYDDTSRSPSNIHRSTAPSPKPENHLARL